jgi:tRNA (uracil-5-)-methyltransferase TRM9
MIYVWAYEQSSGSKRRMGATAGPPAPLPAEPATRESAGTGEQEPPKVQDVLVPWVLRPPKAPIPSSTCESSEAAQSDEPVQGPALEPRVLHRYYHLFVQGELRELVVSAAKEDGYRVLGSTEGESGEIEDESASEPLSSDTRWIKIRGVGWEADNWWIEGEVGIGPVSSPPV